MRWLGSVTVSGLNVVRLLIVIRNRLFCDSALRFSFALGSAFSCASLTLFHVKDPRGPAEAVRPMIAAALSKLVAKVEEARLALEDAQTLFAWPMVGVRTRDSYSGRAARCGNVGTAFLASAGVGASDAMRSAATLADELTKADAARCGEYKKCGAQARSRARGRFRFHS